MYVFCTRSEQGCELLLGKLIPFNASPYQLVIKLEAQS